MRAVQIINRTTGAVLATDARAARTMFTRLRGLLGTRNLPEGSGLLIEPCNSVHMLGMRYPILAVYLDRGGVVLRSMVLRPWWFGPLVPRAHAVLELPASLAGMVARGEQLERS